MRRLLFLFTVLLFSKLSVAQDRVTWTFSYNKESGHFEAKAEIAEGWHLYSQHIDNELGPVPTSFTFEENADLKLVGKVREPESIKEYDENFEGELNFFKEEVVFTQKIKASKSTELKGSVMFMVCNDTMCLPPTDKEFTVRID